MTKRNKWAAMAILFVAALATTTACSNDNEDKGKPAMPRGENEQVAIRYIDQDSLENNYNLAKDFNESLIRESNRLDQTARQREQAITNLAKSMQQKYQNNQYLSQDAMAADEQKLNQMREAAEQELAKMQQDLQNLEMQYTKQLNDSVDNFLKGYAKEKGYDIILRKQAAMYIDEKYDITDDVVKGLNKRYNKVEQKKEE